MTVKLVFFMKYKLLIFAANDEGYTFHHKVDLTFDSPQNVMGAAIDVLKNLHSVFGEAIELMLLENKSVIVNGDTVHGCMATSANIPWSCFIPELEIEGGNPITWCPDLPKYSRIGRGPEC